MMSPVVDPIAIQMVLVMYAESKGVPRDVAWSLAQEQTPAGGLLPASPVAMYDEFDRLLADRGYS